MNIDYPTYERHEGMFLLKKFSSMKKELRMRVLISGGGIAGLTLAYWLHWYGFEPTPPIKSGQE